VKEIPNHLEIYAFNLATHSYEWIYSPESEVYVYNDKISEKLVLPEEHKGLIDILLSDDVSNIEGDIIEGKGTGTIILAKGRAGIGKTVTAEVYSEKRELPLYSVHSGQLGLDGTRIEEKLKEVFERAERWGCILLLDEADSFIRTRGDNIEHNAIVAGWLRNLEYYSGILFMTSNILDIDEAIESRCIAVLKYEMPSEEMRKSLWKLFISQFNLEVTEETVERLVEKMTDYSGRDIKNVCMLVSRYSSGKNMDGYLDFDVFKVCATFRGKYAIQ
jgi:SpoVK/Ycf46/Vps4 family AAA+-type ATPase